jgi:HPt (histidine-containing phosphotransfer) domain-containing protein
MSMVCTDELLDYGLIAEIKRVGHVTGRDDLLFGFIRNLEDNLAGFEGTFRQCLERGDAKGAVRAAHTLKGSCRQLGAHALGDLFAEVERSAKAGDYASARREFEAGAGLIARSLQALKQA